MPSLLFLAAILARSIARVPLGLLFGHEVNLPRGFLFFLAGDAGGFGRFGFFVAPLRLGPFGFAPRLCLLAIGGNRLALGTTFCDIGIVLPRLSAEFVQKVFLGLRRRFLTVSET